MGVRGWQIDSCRPQWMAQRGGPEEVRLENLAAKHLLILKAVLTEAPAPTDLQVPKTKPRREALACADRPSGTLSILVAVAAGLGSCMKGHRSWAVVLSLGAAGLCRSGWVCSSHSRTLCMLLSLTSTSSTQQSRFGWAWWLWHISGHSWQFGLRIRLSLPCAWRSCRLSGSGIDDSGAAGSNGPTRFSNVKPGFGWLPNWRWASGAG